MCDMRCNVYVYMYVCMCVCVYVSTKNGNAHNRILTASIVPCFHYNYVRNV